MDNLLDNFLNTAINDVLRSNIYRDSFSSQNGYNIEEFEYILPDHDDISSTLLLDIVTRFGSPGNDSIQEHMKNYRKAQIKNIGKYKKIKEINNLSECPICLEEFKQGEYYRKLECKHLFHKKCIDHWFKKDHSDCPMCRTKIIN